MKYLFAILMLAGCSETDYSNIPVELTYQNGQIDTVQAHAYIIDGGHFGLSRYGCVSPKVEQTFCGVRSYRILKPIK